MVARGVGVGEIDDRGQIIDLFDELGRDGSGLIFVAVAVQDERYGG